MESKLLLESTKDEHEFQAPQLHMIQLVNQKVVIKSTDSNGNPEHELELTITNGVLEIIPIPAVSAMQLSASLSSSCEMENEEDSSSVCNQVQEEELKMHPLLIYLITLKIGKYLSPKDLMAARLTCKQWSDVLKPYQAVQLSKLNNNDNDDQESSSNLQDFLQHHSNNAISMVQFTKYYITKISFINQGTYSLSTLFQQYGKFMKKLTINVDRVELNLAQFRNILKLTPALSEFIVIDPTYYRNNIIPLETKFWNQGPLFNEQEFPKTFLLKLQKLKFNFDSGFLHKDDQSKKFLTELLNTTNNLRVFSIKLWRRLLVSTFKGLVVFPVGNNPTKPNKSILLALSHNETRLEQLKGLRLHFILGKDEVQQLIQLSRRELNKLVLNKFSFLISTIDERDYTARGGGGIFGIGNFLELQAESLKSLNIKIHGSISTPTTGLSLHLPVMKQLESLKLNINSINSVKIEFDGSTFNNNFPRLKSFRYLNNKVTAGHGKDEIMTWFNPLTFPTPYLGLHELQVDYIHSTNELVRLSTLFPNVVKLHVRLESVQLVKELWSTCWSKLQSLTILLKKHDSDFSKECLLLDEYISGIPKEYFESCMAAYKASNHSWECLNDLNKQFKIMQGISQLKHLSNFEFKSETDNIGLSDISIYFGLMSQNSNLKSVVIENGKVSAECRMTVREKLGLENYIHFGSNVLTQ